MPVAKPRLERYPNVMRNMPVRLMNSGKSSVAQTAAAGEANNPMKKKESPAVEGMPMRKPPSLSPHLDEATAMIITHRPITPNVTDRRRAVESDCSNETQRAQASLDLNFHPRHPQSPCNQARSFPH